MTFNEQTVGSRGKSTENSIQAVLRTMAKNRNFNFLRFYDTRSTGARIKLPRQPADYMFVVNSMMFFLEAKETKHDSRLKRGDFSQLPDLRRWEMCGSNIIVLIHHTGIDRWRAPEFRLFKEDPSAASWDLTNEISYNTAREALEYAIERVS